MRCAADGHIDLTACFQPHENACAYAVIYARSPEARKAVVSAGSDDGVRIWVNGKLAVNHDIYRGAAPGQERADVELNAGWNEVLVKVTQGVGGWGFFFDLLGPDGKPMADVGYSPRKR